MKNDKMVRFLKNIMVLIAVLPMLGSCIREDELPILRRETLKPSGKLSTSSTASWNTNR